MSRAYGSRSEIDIDERRSTRNGRRQQYEEDDIDVRIKRESGRAPVRERVVYKERDDRDSRGPAYLRDDYGRSSMSGALVLKKRETEDFDVVRRRRDSSPEPRREEERIIIKRDQSRGPPPRRREESVEREEIIIKRDQSRGPPPRRRAQSVDREEIIIKRDERESVAPSRRSTRRDDVEEEKIIVRRRERDDYRPAREELDRRETIIIDDDRGRERAKSRVRYVDEEESDDEITIKREERPRGGYREEIRIVRNEPSRSPSPEPVPEPEPVVEPPPRQIVYAPEIHQEVVTHHRHIDHGFDVQLANKRRDEYVYSRPASPVRVPSPPPRRERSEERIEIRRTDTRNGRREEEDIIIDRRDRSEPPPRREERKEETLEIDFRRGNFEEERETFRERNEQATIGGRFGKQRDPTEGLWTEVTKDLVVKEAIEEMGYEYQETDEFYYIFKYMKYQDVARLVGLSEDIRKDRFKRINEIRWENEFSPRPAIEEPPRRLAIEAPRRVDSPRLSDFGRRERDDFYASDRRRDDFERDSERYIEREIVYRGGRPPPPPGWRMR